MRHYLCHCAIFHVLKLLLYCLGIKVANAEENIPGIEVSVPPYHIALSGDLHIHIAASSFPPLLLQLSRLEGDATQTLTTFPVLPEARALSLNKTIVKVPCGYFSRGGIYFILIKKQPIGGNWTRENTKSPVITRSLDVRWPMPQLSLTPEHVQTYPERPVIAILEFPDVVCSPKTDSPAVAIPEFWLELHYCGPSLLTCDNNYYANQSNIQILRSEQVRGFPGRREFTLPCELFGLAGHYALFLRPTAPNPPLPHTAAYVKADWSDQFVFNVNAHSIYPCDPHNGGITVLFQYPSCILDSDRVRLYARLRANVASLAPPSSLEYIAEQRVVRNQHKLLFDCDLFTEHYVEYCFVYVSQAITGAVADVRMDCVPTLPVTDSDIGGWGPWSEWTACSSTCVGGTRTRHRFCDSPPPRYGAKFCEGPMVETEKCGMSVGESWECLYGNGIPNNNIAVEIPEVEAEVGPYCRCGCVVHLGYTKPRRLLATSSQSCPGRTFWQIQADKGHIIQFVVEQFRLPCGTQWLKVRDGTSLSANLLADLSGAPDTTPSVVNSTGPNLLLEFFSDETISGRQICGGGFLAHATQLRPSKSNITAIPIAQERGVLPAVVMKLSGIQIAAIFFSSGLILATVLLGLQYLIRYRKYHIAQAEDQDSLASASCTSLPVRTRASSNATLLSEVISLTRLKPSINLRNKHSRLRESMECEQDEEVQEVTLAKEEESLSISSTTTLTQQATAALPQTASETEESTVSMPSSPNYYEQKKLKRSSTLVNEKDDEPEKSPALARFPRRFSNVSTTTMTNVRSSAENCSKSDPGCYSPAVSIISTATIRSTNPKENKEKRNRQKLLAGPVGSEFSLNGQDVDLEMDYYDYNVVNAAAAPGSYLGMDPAFLVWIPPLDESGEILQDIEGGEYHEMDILPKQNVDPGSNTESPEEEMLLPKRVPVQNDNKAFEENRYSSSGKDKDISETIPLMQEDTNKSIGVRGKDFPKLKTCEVALKARKGREKEIRVEKSPSTDSNYDDIKFADDDEDETDVSANDTQCNIDLSYQDSNIISSS